jgi:hypothetical protein
MAQKTADKMMAYTALDPSTNPTYYSARQTEIGAAQKCSRWVWESFHSNSIDVVRPKRRFHARVVFPGRPSNILRGLGRLPLGDALLDIGRGLLHGVQFPVPGHAPVVLAISRDQALKPLDFPLTLFPRRLPGSIACCLLQLPDNGVLGLVCSPLRDHGKAVPLLYLAIAALELYEWVVERIELFLALAGNAQNVASLRITLNFDLLDLESLCGSLGDDVEGVGGAVGGCVGARRLGVIEAEQGNSLLRATGGVVEAGGKTEAAVVLRESLLLVPAGVSRKKTPRARSQRTSALR